MSEPDPREVWIEVMGWIKVAASDGRAVSACLNSDPPLCDIAAYHCQQAAEKLLKGFLVLAGRDFRKTHDLGQLADQVTQAFPVVGPMLDAMRDWTDWSVEYRYPALGDEEPEPEPDVLEAALEVIGAVKVARLSYAPAP